jgi:Holliday junction resolvase RusA-like endonuclease
MYKIHIPIRPQVKPAGAIYNGHITQNKYGYSDWKKKAHTLLKDCPKGLEPYGWVIVHNNPDWSHGDLLNLVGATMDALVKAKVVQDDAPRWVNKVYTSLTRELPVGIDIYICENSEELIKAICEYY